MQSLNGSMRATTLATNMHVQKKLVISNETNRLRTHKICNKDLCAVKNDDKDEIMGI